MTAAPPDPITEGILAAIGKIAPEADLATLDPSADLREALDIDSFDFLQIVVGLSERFGRDIPEKDYPRMRTLGALRSYLAASQADRPG